MRWYHRTASCACVLVVCLAATTTADDKKDEKTEPDVVFVATPQEVVEKMLEVAKATKDDVVYDLGCGDGRMVITAVKMFHTDVSPFGIFDLAGNAREWCSDRWSPTAFAEAQRSSQNPPRNWTGAKTAQPAEFHTVKVNGPHWDAWYREGRIGLQRHADVGFRCVLRLNEKT